MQMFHVSPVQNREQIMETGLFRGTYLWEDEALALMYGDHYVLDDLWEDEDMRPHLVEAYDLWYVDVQGLQEQIVEDPEDDAQSAWQIWTDVQPSRLRVEQTVKK